jgi:hypothetical protein
MRVLVVGSISTLVQLLSISASLERVRQERELQERILAPILEPIEYVEEPVAPDVACIWSQYLDMRTNRAVCDRRIFAVARSPPV